MRFKKISGLGINRKYTALLALGLCFSQFLSFNGAFAKGEGEELEVVSEGIYSVILKDFPEAKGDFSFFFMTKYIFNMNGHKHQQKVIPPKRMPVSLNNQNIDMFLVAEGEPRAKEGILAKYPMSIDSVGIYYKKSTDWKPSWPATENFKRVRGVDKDMEDSHRGFGLSIRQVQSYQAAAKMVNKGRAEYWLVWYTVFEQSKPLLKTEAEGFAIEKLYPVAAFYVFPDTARGKKLKSIYDLGVEKVIKDGNFEELYLKNTGELKDYFRRTRLEPLADYYKKNFPHLAPYF